MFLCFRECSIITGIARIFWLNYCRKSYVLAKPPRCRSILGIFIFYESYIVAIDTVYGKAMSPIRVWRQKKTRIMRALGLEQCVFGSHFRLSKKKRLPMASGRAGLQERGAGPQEVPFCVHESFHKGQTVTKSQHKTKHPTFSSSSTQSPGNERSSELGSLALT